MRRANCEENFFFSETRHTIASLSHSSICKCPAGLVEAIVKIVEVGTEA